MNNENKKGFQVKDLIVTALMVVCAILLYMISAILSFSPYTMILVSPIWAILAAITYFLVAVRTKNPIMLLIFCIVSSLGNFYLPAIICCTIAGIISLILTKKMGCMNEKAITIGWIVYTVAFGFGGMYVPFLFFADQTLAQYGEMFGEDYLTALTNLTSPLLAIGMLCVTAFCAFIGALIAKKMLKKHFKKAGMV